MRPWRQSIEAGLVVREYGDPAGAPVVCSALLPINVRTYARGTPVSNARIAEVNGLLREPDDLAQRLLAQSGCNAGGGKAGGKCHAPRYKKRLWRANRKKWLHGQI